MYEVCGGATKWNWTALYTWYVRVWKWICAVRVTIKKTDWELSVARKLQLDRWPVTKPKVIEWRIEISYAGSHFFVLFSLFIHPNNIHNRMALNALYAAVPANEISSVHRPTSPLLSPTGRSTVIAYSLTSTIPAFLYYKCGDKVLEPGNNASSIFFFLSLSVFCDPEFGFLFP